MAKQALGRNLAVLMAPAQPTVSSSSSGGQASPGVRSLMRGHSTVSPEPQAEIVVAAKPPVPVWYLWSADLLLTALALMIVWKSPHPLSWQRELFCGLLVALGGCLALGAAMFDEFW